MQQPLTASLGAISSVGTSLSEVASDASSNLSSNRDFANSARPAFPGDATDAFDRAMESLQNSDEAINIAVQNTAGSVQDAAVGYSGTDSSSADKFTALGAIGGNIPQ